LVQNRVSLFIIEQKQSGEMFYLSVALFLGTIRKRWSLLWCKRISFNKKTSYL